MCQARVWKQEYKSTHKRDRLVYCRNINRLGAMQIFYQRECATCSARITTAEAVFLSHVKALSEVDAVFKRTEPKALFCALQ